MIEHPPPPGVVQLEELAARGRFVAACVKGRGVTPSAVGTQYRLSGQAE